MTDSKELENAIACMEQVFPKLSAGDHKAALRRVLDVAKSTLPEGRWRWQVRSVDTKIPPRLTYNNYPTREDAERMATELRKSCWCVEVREIEVPA